METACVYCHSLEVQKTASSAVDWCRSKGGQVDGDDLVVRIAKLGTEGKHKANIERDFHTFLKHLNHRLGAKISHIKVRTAIIKKHCSSRQNVV